MHDFQKRISGLGDLPDNSPTGRPTRDIRGLDTTGSRSGNPNSTAQSSSDSLNQIAQQQANPSASANAFILPSLVLLTNAIYQKANFTQLAANVNSSGALLIRPAENRTYFLVQNNSAAVVYLGFGFAPSSSTGMFLPANGVYEPFKVPQGDVFVLGSTAGNQQISVLYANG